MTRSDLVANTKPAAVRVYDYYEPGKVYCFGGCIYDSLNVLVNMTLATVNTVLNYRESN